MATTVSTKGKGAAARNGRRHNPLPRGKPTTKGVLRPPEQFSKQARMVISPISGLPAIEPPEGAPEISTEQVRTLLANFP